MPDGDVLFEDSSMLGLVSTKATAMYGFFSALDPQMVSQAGLVFVGAVAIRTLKSWNCLESLFSIQCFRSVPL